MDSDRKIPNGPKDSAIFIEDDLFLDSEEDDDIFEGGESPDQAPSYVPPAVNHTNDPAKKKQQFKTDLAIYTSQEFIEDL